MTNAYAMRNLMELGNYNTSITREAFEAHFTKTKESIRFTFNGWDSEELKAWYAEDAAAKFPFESGVSKAYRAWDIEEDRMITEKATGEQHPEASWLVEVERA